MEAGFFVCPCRTETRSELDNERQEHCEKKENDVLMMSDSTKRIQASTLRSSRLEEKTSSFMRAAENGPGHDRSATEDGQESRGFPPVDSVHRWRNRAPGRFETLLHFKGFAGGVPLNTERTTVKPWVGIAR